MLRDRGHGEYMPHFIWNAVRKSAPKEKQMEEQMDKDSLMMRFAQTVDPNVFKNLCENAIKKSRRQKK